MKTFAAFILSISPFICIGQTSEITKTDTSVIRKNYYKQFGYIGEFNELNDLDKTYYRKFDYETGELTEEGVFVNGFNSGIWKHYSDGELIKTVDHDSGETTYYTEEKLPFEDYFGFIKSTADSILSHMYGEFFLRNNIKWNSSASYYYAPGVASVWHDEATVKPNEFILRYDVEFSGYKYPLIALNLDSAGRLIIDDYNNKGLRTINSQNCRFSIDIDKAIEIAKSSGIKFKRQPFVFLRIAFDNQEDLQVVVAVFDGKTNKDQRTRYRYQSVVINPWSGEIHSTPILESLDKYDQNSSYRAERMYTVSE